MPISKLYEMYIENCCNDLKPKDIVIIIWMIIKVEFHWYDYVTIKWIFKFIQIINVYELYNENITMIMS